MGNGASPTIVAALLLGAVALLGQFVPSTARAGGRVALVIGNADYKEAPLRNPVNDARAMAASLKDLGFDVISVENAGKAAMERAIVEFTGRLDENSSGLFYYAGHGVQISGRNYMVPVDARIRSEREARIEAVGVNLVLDELEYAGNRLNVVILDACRNNPFGRRLRGASRGLAAIDAGRGTLIAYATSPGSVAQDGDGRNGLYTEELLRALRIPGLEVEEVFKQVRVQVSRRTDHQQIPWESSSLTGQFIFNRPSPKASTASSTENRNETLYWKSVEGSGTEEGYRAYLQEFPNGVFSSLAALRIEELEAASAAQSSVPPPSSTVDTAMAPSAIAPGSPSQSRVRGQYQIAVLPEDGKIRCLSGLFDHAELARLVSTVIRALNRSESVTAAYFPDGSMIGNGGDLVTRQNLWHPDGLRRRPNENRAYEYGRQMEVDAVLLLWYEARGRGYCKLLDFRAFLYDVRLGKVYTAEASVEDLDNLSASLIDSLRAGRTVAREN